MPATSPNWYFAWQALSLCHSPDFPAARTQPWFGSCFCCLPLLPGRMAQLTGLGREVHGGLHTGRAPLRGSMELPSALRWAGWRLRSFPNDDPAEIPLWGRFYGAQVAHLVTTPPATAGDPRDLGSIPGLERAPGVGNGQHVPVFLPRKSHGERSLEGYSPHGRTESDTTEHTQAHRKVPSTQDPQARVCPKPPPPGGVPPPHHSYHSQLTLVSTRDTAACRSWPSSLTRAEPTGALSFFQKLKCSWFTMSCQVLVYNKAIQLYIHITTPFRVLFHYGLLIGHWM